MNKAVETLEGIIPQFEAYVECETDADIKERNEAWLAQAKSVVAESKSKAA